MINILEVLDYYEIDYTNISNDRYKSVCPFHNDTDPSLVIYTENKERHSYCCYVCNNAGDATWFIRQIENEDINEYHKVLKALGSTETRPLTKVKTVSYAEVNFVLSQEYRKLGIQQPALYDLIDLQFKLLDSDLLRDPMTVFNEHKEFIMKRSTDVR